jgi:hypothetical protein
LLEEPFTNYYNAKTDNEPLRMFCGDQIMKISVILIILLSLLMSCGSKTQSSRAKITFASGNSSVLASGVQMNGGIIVVGHRVDDTENINIGLLNANDEKILEIKKGVWEFAAIGWEGGNGVFTGANRCAYSGIIDINQNDTAITFNLDYDTCANIPGHGAIVSNPDFMTSSAAIANQFKNVIVQSCDTLVSNGTTSPANCTPPGLTGSFKFVAIGEQKGTGGKFPLPSLETSCIATTSGSATTSLKLPVGNVIGAKKENILQLKLLAFQTADCSDTPIVYSYNDSMYAGINQTNMKSSVETAAVNSYFKLYIEHNPTTVSSNIGYNPFGYGKDGDITTSTSIAQPVGDFGAISSIGTTSPTVMVSSGTGGGINVNDEIMWFVNSETTAGACGGPNGFEPGMFGFAQVVAKTIGTFTTFTLNRAINDYELNGNPPTKVMLPLPTSYTACLMQIVRVPHYRNIIANTASISINAYKFGVTPGVGGILPFKVSNAVQIGGSAAFIVNANGAGATSATVFGCSSTAKRCMQMGGGTPLAPGGGIIMAWINQVNTASSVANALEIHSSGLGSSSSAGGGGGFINTNINKIIYSGSGSSPVIIQNADGGVGIGGSVAFPGISHFKYCDNSFGLTIPTAPTNTTQNCAF